VFNSARFLFTVEVQKILFVCIQFSKLYLHSRLCKIGNYKSQCQKVCFFNFRVCVVCVICGVCVCMVCGVCVAWCVCVCVCVVYVICGVCVCVVCVCVVWCDVGVRSGVCV